MCLLGICDGRDWRFVFIESGFVEGGVGRREGISCMGSMTAAIVSDGVFLEVNRLLLKKYVEGLQIEDLSKTKSRIYASLLVHAREDTGGE
jgi:hypothetical protein